MTEYPQPYWRWLNRMNQLSISSFPPDHWDRDDFYVDCKKSMDIRKKWVCSSPSTDISSNSEDLINRKCKYCYLCSTQSKQLKQQQPPKRRPLEQRDHIRVIVRDSCWQGRRKPKKLKIRVEEVLYKVIITTGCETNAGTNANVFITIIGSADNLPKTQLHKPQGSVNFNFRNSISEAFFIRGPSLGNIKKVILQHDGVQKTQGWYVEKVSIQDLAHKRQWICTCGKWLSLYEGQFANIAQLDAVPVDVDTTDYLITILTGTCMFAGTDANVYCTLYGKSSQTKKILLYDKSKICFEKGSTDSFTVSHKDIGDLEKLRVEHDGTGSASGWFLDKIVVSKDGKSFEFVCNDWLSTSENDRELFKILYPTSSQKESDKTKYELKIHTGDVRFAGTHSNIYIILRGTKGNTGKIPLPNDNKDYFKRNQVDTITVMAANVGAVKNLTVGHDNTGIGPGWYLSTIILRVYLNDDEATELIERHEQRLKCNINVEVRRLNDYINSSRFSEFKDLEREILLEYEEGKRLVNRTLKKSSHSDFYTDSNLYDQAHLRGGADATEEMNDIKKPRYKEYTFVCNNWLARDEDDGSLERELIYESMKTFYEY